MLKKVLKFGDSVIWLFENDNRILIKQWKNIYFSQIGNCFNKKVNLTSPMFPPFKNFHGKEFVIAMMEVN